MQVRLRTSQAHVVCPMLLILPSWAPRSSTRAWKCLAEGNIGGDLFVIMIHGKWLMLIFQYIHIDLPPLLRSEISEISCCYYQVHVNHYLLHSLLIPNSSLGNLSKTREQTPYYLVEAYQRARPHPIIPRYPHLHRESRNSTNSLLCRSQHQHRNDMCGAPSSGCVFTEYRGYCAGVC